MSKKTVYILLAVLAAAAGFWYWKKRSAPRVPVAKVATPITSASPSGANAAAAGG